MTSKILIVLVSLLVYSCEGISEEDRVYFLGIRTHCYDKHEVPHETWHRLKEGEMFDDDNFKTSVLCVFKELNLLDDNGKYQYDNIKMELAKGLNEKESEYMISHCFVQKDLPPIDLVYDCALCIHDINVYHKFD